jgi:hypothetical protein
MELICPTRQISPHSASRDDEGPKNPLRANFDLRWDFKLIWVVQSPWQKQFAFAVGQISSISLPHLIPRRGGSRSSRTRDGMRWTRQRWAREMTAGQVSCERFTARRTNGAIRVRQNRVVLTPVAGAKSAEACRAQPGSERAINPRDDGDKTNSSPGRARHKP